MAVYSNYGYFSAINGGLLSEFYGVCNVCINMVWYGLIGG